jgi:hypothetical protein
MKVLLLLGINVAFALAVNSTSSFLLSSENGEFNG